MGTLPLWVKERARFVCRQREKRKGGRRGLQLGVGTPNVETLTGKAREMLDMIKEEKKEKEEKFWRHLCSDPEFPQK